MSWLHGLRARFDLLRSGRAADARFREEIDFHVDMETDRLRRERGLDPVEARRGALVAFGGVVNHREALHDGRGLRWLNGFSLDFRLGLRMLVKYPGLTIVGSLAMAFAIWAGAVTLEMVGSLKKASRVGRFRIDSARFFRYYSPNAAGRAFHTRYSDAGIIVFQGC